jgi:hypothetical protein
MTTEPLEVVREYADRLSNGDLDVLDDMGLLIQLGAGPQTSRS